MGPEEFEGFDGVEDAVLGVNEADAVLGKGPLPAAILGTALTLFHAGRAQAERGQGIYFYLPKVEDVEDMRWYRDLFDARLHRSSAGSV